MPQAKSFEWLRQDHKPSIVASKILQTLKLGHVQLFCNVVAPVAITSRHIVGLATAIKRLQVSASQGFTYPATLPPESLLGSQGNQKRMPCPPYTYWLLVIRLFVLPVCAPSFIGKRLSLLGRDSCIVDPDCFLDVLKTSCPHTLHPRPSHGSSPFDGSSGMQRT